MSINLRLPKMQQSGDTIVEVMIVLAVLGLAIGISYSTASRALLQARQAQENTKATVLLQSQIEQLTTMTTYESTDADHYIFRSDAFCIDSATKRVVTGAACEDIDTYYNINVTYDSARHTFTLQARWDDIDGNGEGKDTVTLRYRLHPS